MGPPSVFEIFPPAASSSSASGKMKDPPHSSINTNIDPTMMLQPTSRDILCGKDKTYAKHPGNALYRATIAAQSGEYAALGSAKQAKMNLTKRIVEQLRQQGARFLQQRADGVWTAITDQQARDKTSHALRFHQNRQAQSQQQHQQVGPSCTMPEMVPIDHNPSLPPPAASTSTTTTGGQFHHRRVDSDLTILQGNSDHTPTPTSTTGVAATTTDHRTEITPNGMVSPQQQQLPPPTSSHNVNSTSSMNSTRSVEFCMSVLVEAAEQQSAREQQQQQQQNHSHSDAMDYQPSDTLRSEDLNRLFQMGDNDWDSVMKQQNQSSVRSWSSLTVVGESPPTTHPHHSSRGVATSNNNNNNNTASPHHPTAVGTPSVAPPPDRPWTYGGTATMMQSTDSLRSTATTSSSMGRMSMTPGDTMRSEDLNRLFQMGDKDWDTVMEE